MYNGDFGARNGCAERAEDQSTEGFRSEINLLRRELQSVASQSIGNSGRRRPPGVTTYSS